MDRQKIELATTFFADASEYKKNKNVRGYFGRGLKETIIALGIGEIITIKDNKLNRIKRKLKSNADPNLFIETSSSSKECKR